MGKKEFVAAVLNLESETFVVYVASLNFDTSLSFSPLELNVYPFRKLQIFSLIAKKIPIKVSTKYSDFANIFSPDLVSELSKHTGINDHAIKLIDGQKPPYRSIYSLGPVELETLKAYIETNLANGFIRPFKVPAGTLILFNRKSDGSLRLCVNYRDLNNLMIKNWYPLLLIEELLDRLRRAKQFTQLDFTSAYYWKKIRKEDKWKTAFRTRYSYFEYRVMLFGIMNAPTSFQGYINKIFAKKLNIFVSLYLDDILIYTDDNKDGYVTAVRWVLEQLRKFSLYAKLKKYQFHQEKVWFFGYVMSSKGIHMEDKKIEAVKQWSEPQSVRDIQVFLRFANF